MSTEASCEVLTVKDLMADPMFAGVPPKFLLWQQGLAVRCNVRPGEVLCRQGDPGNTAFLIRRGRLKVTGWPPKSRGRGKPLFEAEITPADRIVGEMACLAGTPRMADVTAVEDSEIWEIRRNLLDRMMRSPNQRATFERLYRDRALGEALRQSDLFRDRTGDPFPRDEYESCLAFLRGDRAPGVPRLTFVRVNPDQTLFRQGDRADDFYLLRLGNLRISVSRFGGEGSVSLCGPGSVLGEIGILSLARAGVEEETRTVEQIEKDVAAALMATADEELPNAMSAGRRTASCVALDHVELARVRRADFLLMMKRFPTVRRRLLQTMISRLRNDVSPEVERPLTRKYIDLELFQAQNLLALDMTRCTHCDECTKACVEQHGTESHGIPITRLLRDGVRLEHFLVATYCLAGCPVDAIHRGKHQQIVIEDHCIGCGLCAQNCPYGNIWMVPNEGRKLEVADPDNPGSTMLIAQAKAAACDLCDAEGKLEEPMPRCVYACPHDAAHRMTGEQLLAKVTGG
jgi:CRP-like cAMP-binding protein/Fe-S-cluster-containing hydrogenase component 2